MKKLDNPFGMIGPYIGAILGLWYIIMYSCRYGSNLQVAFETLWPVIILGFLLGFWANIVNRRIRK